MTVGQRSYHDRLWAIDNRIMDLWRDTHKENRLGDQELALLKANLSTLHDSMQAFIRQYQDIVENEDAACTTKLL